MKVSGFCGAAIAPACEYMMGTRRGRERLVQLDRPLECGEVQLMRRGSNKSRAWLDGEKVGRSAKIKTAPKRVRIVAN